MILTDDYQCEPEEEKQQTSEKLDNKLLGEQPDKSKLPKWVKVNKTRFDVIKSKVQNAKKKLQVRLKGSKAININESNKLLNEIKKVKLPMKNH